MNTMLWSYVAQMVRESKLKIFKIIRDRYRIAATLILKVSKNLDKQILHKLLK